MSVPRGDEMPDRPTLVGACCVCHGTVTTEDEHSEFGLGINDCMHNDCDRRGGDRRGTERRRE